MKNLKIDRLSSNRFDENELSKINGGLRRSLCAIACLCEYEEDSNYSTFNNAQANGGYNAYSDRF